MTENQFVTWVLVFVVVVWTGSVASILVLDKSVPEMEQTVCKSVPQTYQDLVTPKAEALSQHIAKTYRVKPQLATNIVQTVYAYTDSTDFPGPVLVLAVMATESSFRPDVVSTVGALGLMQVKPVHNPGTTIEDNILTGIWVLQKYRMRVDTDVGAIMAYNIGITAFKSGRTNDKYVDKVVAKQLEFTEVLRY